MIIPTIKDLVLGNKTVKFHHYCSHELWYEHENGFQFPVHISDTAGATFPAEDSAVFFMRWMRKYIAFLTEAHGQT